MFAGAWGAVELGFRAAGHDFDRVEAGHRAQPVFYRIPTRPVGPFAYRRPGNEVWSGQPLRTRMRALGLGDGPYAEEPAITAAYDADGFRNPPGLRDWSVVVVGDSFTELGHLPDQQLFTTALARRLGEPVRNLGTSYTALFTHVVYLRQFGRAPSARDAVCVFFEGNDCGDLLREARLAQRIARGEVEHVDPLEAHAPQSSVTRSLLAALGGRGDEPARHPGGAVPARWTPPGGAPLEVTLDYAPPGRAQLGPVGPLLEAAVAEWRRACDDLGLRAWLLYMPCKHRVLRGAGRLEVGDPALAGWRPTDLPAHVRQLCARSGVRFVDATPPLVAAARAGRMPFVALYDSHLDRLGSRIVGELLAAELGRAGR